MTRSHSTLRELIRGILQEDAGPGKSLSLVSQLQAVNSGLADAGLGLEVGIFYTSNMNNSEIAFALQNTGWRDRGLKPILLATRTPEGTPNIDRMVRQALDRDEASQDSDPKTGPAAAAIAQIPWGSISFSNPSYITDEGPCSKARVVRLTTGTRSGWGPLLYDLAMEKASSGGGLTPDRHSVSPDARAIWQKYDTARPDVEKVQLDVPRETLQSRPDFWREQLTPDDDSDDCGMTSASEEERDGWWHASPLSRAYRKSGGGTTAALDAAGLLWRPGR